MNLQLSDKRALVTGSTSGIGEQIAKTLAAEGVSVVIHGRRESEARRVAKAIIDAGGKAVVALGDLGSDEQAAKVIQTSLSAFGGIDILVNNAGGSGDKKSWDQAIPGDWSDLYNQNVLAIIRLVRRLVPPMRVAGWGRVVNISSAAGILPAATGADYSAAKAAVNNLTLSLSKEVGRDGITVNAISPGPILTPKLEKFFRSFARDHGWADGGRGEWAEVEKAVLENMFDMSISRVGHVQDVAHAVTFLCSPLAGFITGANLRIDGGTIPTV